MLHVHVPLLISRPPPPSPLQLIQSMLMPAVDFRDTESAELQSHFVRCGGLRLLLEIVTNKNFMAQRDNTLKRWANLGFSEACFCVGSEAGRFISLPVSQGSIYKNMLGGEDGEVRERSECNILGGS